MNAASGRGKRRRISESMTTPSCRSEQGRGLGSSFPLISGGEGGGEGGGKQVQLQSEYDSLGPFGILHRAVRERLSVRVTLRAARGLRSTIAGKLMAFDKHFNLVSEEKLRLLLLSLENYIFQLPLLNDENLCHLSYLLSLYFL